MKYRIEIPYFLLAMNGFIIVVSVYTAVKCVHFDWFSIPHQSFECIAYNGLSLDDTLDNLLVDSLPYNIDYSVSTASLPSVDFSYGLEKIRQLFISF